MSDGDLIRALEALRVASDEVLLLRLPESQAGEAHEVAEALRAAGLAGRCLLIVNDAAELTVVPKTP